MRIVVLNPNSTEAVTEGIDAALDPLRRGGGPEIECATLAEGPPGIETDAHVRAVAAPIARFVASREDAADAFIIACFSDPGLVEARRAARRPVLGMAACGVFTASRSRVPLRRDLHPRAGNPAASPLLRMRLASGLGSRATGRSGIGVTGLADESRTLDRLMATGRNALRDEDGADVLVLGCAGMARYRERLEDSLGDSGRRSGVQAAAGMAIVGAGEARYPQPDDARTRDRGNRRNSWSGISVPMPSR